MYINKIFNEDCLIGMNRIPNGAIDLVICDLPYGTTDLEWDTVIPFDSLWKQYKRVCKPNAAILLFGAQPFTTDLINSNRKMFRYEIIWEKTLAVGFLNAKKIPLKAHENICVFYSKMPTYNPIKTYIKETYRRRKQSGVAKQYSKTRGETIYENDGTRFPRDVVKFSNFTDTGFSGKGNHIHPTQKPVPLIEYLIKTYSNDGDLVLDNCIGSGTTAVAAINTGRRFVGFETNREYFDYANDRINAAIHGDCGHSYISIDKNQLQLF